MARGGNLERAGGRSLHRGMLPAGRARQLPRAAPKLRYFHVIESLIIASVYLSHLLGLDPLTLNRNVAPSLGHTALWTLVIASFALYPLLLKERLVARGWIVPYIAGRLAICAYALWLTRIGFLPTFLYFSLLGEAIELDERVGVLTGVASAAIMYGQVFLMSGPGASESSISLLPWLAGMVFVGGTILLNKREQEARARSDTLLIELTAAHRQLQDYTEQVRDLATTQERNRLAREIHDSLGHYLTVINVQLESAQALRPRDAVRADRAVGAAKRLASEALADVRRSVAALRPTALDQLSIGTAIERQVADFREHSGLPVALTIEGDEGHCSQAAGLALYRAVQEGLTNVRKHAAASSALVTLRFGPATTELTVRDDGRGLAEPQDRSVPPPAGGGFGLTGLRERMAMLGGSLDIGPIEGGGTELRVTIPREGTVAGRPVPPRAPREETRRDETVRR